MDEVLLVSKFVVSTSNIENWYLEVQMDVRWITSRNWTMFNSDLSLIKVWLIGTDIRKELNKGTQLLHFPPIHSLNVSPSAVIVLPVNSFPQAHDDLGSSPLIIQLLRKEAWITNLNHSLSWFALSNNWRRWKVASIFPLWMILLNFSFRNPYLCNRFFTIFEGTATKSYLCSLLRGKRGEEKPVNRVNRSGRLMWRRRCWLSDNSGPLLQISNSWSTFALHSAVIDMPGLTRFEERFRFWASNIPTLEKTNFYYIPL